MDHQVRWSVYLIDAETIIPYELTVIEYVDMFNIYYIVISGSIINVVVHVSKVNDKIKISGKGASQYENMIKQAISAFREEHSDSATIVVKPNKPKLTLHKGGKRLIE